jgi:glutamate/tyrosine decarboxylase-like PLP-dependent enzyme
VGCVLDGLVAIPLLAPAVAAAVFRIPGYAPDPLFRYIGGLAATLMLGWSLLLAWASRDPRARRAVLLLTAVPTIAGLMAAGLYALASRALPAGPVIGTLAIQGVLLVLFVAGFVAALPRRSRAAALTWKAAEHLRNQAEDPGILELALRHALEYRAAVGSRGVYPSADALANLATFRVPLPTDPTDPRDILTRLHAVGSPATVAQTGGRYFGFVNGGLVPAALGARWMADTWDQNAALYVMSPVASVLEGVCERWLVDLLGLPAGTAAGFVSGTTTGTICGLAAGRDELLRRQGWDVGARGLFGAPEIRVILGDQAHASVLKALSILGLGKERVVLVPTDNQGRMDARSLPALDANCLLVLQAGNVSTGAFDPFEPICAAARPAGAWVHVDGAFGLWAAASEQKRHLVRGMELADSWSADAHKTLNAPYDNGLVFCRDRAVLAASLRITGSYIIGGQERDGMSYTPDMSRRARSVELWATLMSLGRRGAGELVEGLCETATRFADELARAGFEILNDICFNQVLVRCQNADLTNATLAGVQASGVCWCGGSTWQGGPAIRLSVCSYMTTPSDVDRSVQAFVDAREAARA